MTTQYRFHGATAAAIAASVEAAVAAGELVAGAELPPVRTLARDLGVAAGTVAAAYARLRDRGLVETAGRRGTRVRTGPPDVPRAARALPVPVGARDISSGAPDPARLPVLPPLDLAALPHRTYTDHAVLPELADLARERLRADGVPADHLLLTGGALDAIERLLLARLRPGDPVAVEDPGWGNLLDLLAAGGWRTVPVTVDDEGPEVAAARRALAAGARALVVTSRAQNPTGASVTPGRAAALREVLAGYPDVLVIEDDHAADLAGVPLASLAGAVTGWAFVRSLSKPYGPDLRVAVLAADGPTAARVAGRQRVGTRWVSGLLQSVVLGLWRDVDVSAQVAAAADAYDAVRDGLVEALHDRGVPAHGRTGLNVWVPVADETTAAARLVEAGWVPAPGARFRLRTPPGLRLTIAELDRSDVQPLADAVAAAMVERPRGGA